jgi:DNA-binding response OmpR family regulator
MARTVLLLEDNEDVCRVLVRLIRHETGRTCIVAHSMAELQERRGEALRSSLAILDVDLGLGEPSGLDAFAWLRAEGFAGQIAFVTGHGRSHPLVERARVLGQAQVLAKPFRLKQLMALL